MGQYEVRVSFPSETPAAQVNGNRSFSIGLGVQGGGKPAHVHAEPLGVSDEWGRSSVEAVIPLHDVKDKAAASSRALFLVLDAAEAYGVKINEENLRGTLGKDDPHGEILIDVRDIPGPERPDSMGAFRS